MPYAVIKTGGKQYRVSEGDVINVEKLDLEPGKEATFDEVLFYTDGTSFKTAGTTVTGEVVEQFKDKKVINFKFRRRKGYMKTKGHRRQLTKVRIKSINA